MKVVILSGGLGYRLKEETEFKPKPMVAIGSKPILWHIMKIYSHFGYNDFVVALGYKGDYVKNYFLNQRYLNDHFTIATKNGSIEIHENENCENGKDDFKVTLVDTGLESLPGERILRIKDFIPEEDEDFMVTYGDGLADIDIKGLVAFHKKHGLIGTVSGVHPRSRYGLLMVDDNNVVETFAEKPVLKERINGGFMIFKREFFKHLRPGEYEHEALKRLVKERQLAVYNHEGFWHSMDTYPDVDNLNKLWKEDPKWKIWK
jgi:glucose-1-phosphate cytidylyltransferase